MVEKEYVEYPEMVEMMKRKYLYIWHLVGVKEEVATAAHPTPAPVQQELSYYNFGEIDNILEWDHVRNAWWFKYG